MATNRKSGILSALNDVVYIAMNPEEWNGAVAFFVDGSFTDTFNQLGGGVSKLYNGTPTIVLQVAGNNPDWQGNKIINGFDATSGLVQWTTIFFTQQDTNAAAASLVCDGNNHIGYAEFVGAQVARLKCTNTGAPGVKVTLAAGRA
jgi:hypothetical protein